MASGPVVLLVEGHSAGLDSLAQALRKVSDRIFVVHTGASAVEWLQDHQAQLIVFDASTMRSNGTRNCRRLRKLAENTPIIHSRAAGESIDRAAGADVYLEKPFTARKLLNRVKALLPADRREEEIVRYGALTFFRAKRSVEVAGKGEFTLTPKLALLLETFLRNPNRLLTRSYLMQTVWDTDFLGDTRTLDVHIRWIRECIETTPGKPQYLQTQRKEGYVLTMPPHMISPDDKEQGDRLNGA